MKFKIPRADKLIDHMPIRSKAVMDKPYTSEEFGLRIAPEALTTVGFVAVIT